MKTTPRRLAQTKHSSVFIKLGSFEYELRSNSAQVESAAEDIYHDSPTKRQKEMINNGTYIYNPSTNAWLTACLGNTTQLRGRLTHFFFLDTEKINEAKIGSKYAGQLYLSAVATPLLLLPVRWNGSSAKIK